MNKVRVSLNKADLLHIIGALYVTASKDKTFAESTKHLWQRLQAVREKGGW